MPVLSKTGATVSELSVAAVRLFIWGACLEKRAEAAQSAAPRTAQSKQKITISFSCAAAQSGRPNGTKCFPSSASCTALACCKCKVVLVLVSASGNCGMNKTMVLFSPPDGVAAELLRDDTRGAEGGEERPTVVQDEHEAWQALLRP